MTEAETKSGEVALRVPEHEVLSAEDVTTKYIHLGDMIPGVPYPVGTTFVERVQENKWGNSDIMHLLNDEAKPREWGIRRKQKTVGSVSVHGHQGQYETEEFDDPSIAYMVEAEADAHPLSEVPSVFPEYTYTQGELAAMAERGIKGVVKTRTGTIRHYKEGDSILVHDDLGFRQIPL
jgi:hypothetical protein